MVSFWIKKILSDHKPSSVCAASPIGLAVIVIIYLGAALRRRSRHFSRSACSGGEPRARKAGLIPQSPIPPCTGWGLPSVAGCPAAPRPASALRPRPSGRAFHLWSCCFPTIPKDGWDGQNCYCLCGTFLTATFSQGLRPAIGLRPLPLGVICLSGARTFLSFSRFVPGQSRRGLKTSDYSLIGSPAFSLKLLINASSN